MKVEHGTIVAVADGARLLIFRNEGDEKYPVLETLAHEQQDNPPTQAQGTDTPGRTHASADVHSSGYEETDWHQQAEVQFARHAASVLEGVAGSHPDAGIIVIAAPATLGTLRKHYGRATAARLAAELDKDLAGHSSDDIIAALVAHEA